VGVSGLDEQHACAVAFCAALHQPLERWWRITHRSVRDAMAHRSTPNKAIETDAKRSSSFDENHSFLPLIPQKKQQFLFMLAN